MKVFTQIPRTRPVTPLLDTVNVPEDLRELSPGELPRLADELREYLLYSVGQTGGHFGAGLGVVELTVALHYIFETPFGFLMDGTNHETHERELPDGGKRRFYAMTHDDRFIWGADHPPHDGRRAFPDGTTYRSRPDQDHACRLYPCIPLLRWRARGSAF